MKHGYSFDHTSKRVEQATSQGKNDAIIDVPSLCERPNLVWLVV